eukprot:6467231-Amphidinium_carterae.1
MTSCGEASCDSSCRSCVYYILSVTNAVSNRLFEVLRSFGAFCFLDYFSHGATLEFQTFTFLASRSVLNLPCSKSKTRQVTIMSSACHKDTGCRPYKRCCPSSQ